MRAHPGGTATTARAVPPSGPGLSCGRSGGTSAAPLLGALRARKPPLSAGRTRRRAEGPLSRATDAACGGEGTEVVTCPARAPRTGPGSWAPIRSFGVWSGRVRSRGALAGPGTPAASFSAGLLLISARGGGAGEVSGEGSRPPGRDADGSRPRGYPARPPACPPACQPAPPELWGGGGGGGGGWEGERGGTSGRIGGWWRVVSAPSFEGLREHSCRGQRVAERITQLQRCTQEKIGDRDRDREMHTERDTEQSHTRETERHRGSQDGRRRREGEYRRD